MNPPIHHSTPTARHRPQKQEKSLVFNTKNVYFRQPQTAWQHRAPPSAQPPASPGRCGTRPGPHGASGGLLRDPPGSSPEPPGASRGRAGRGERGRSGAEEAERGARPPAPVAPGDGLRAEGPEGRTDRGTDRRTDGQTDRQTGGQTDGGSGAGAVPGAVAAQGSGWARPRVGPERLERSL